MKFREMNSFILQYIIKFIFLALQYVEPYLLRNILRKIRSTLNEQENERRETISYWMLLNSDIVNGITSSFNFICICLLYNHSYRSILITLVHQLYFEAATKHVFMLYQRNECFLFFKNTYIFQNILQ